MIQDEKTREILCEPHLLAVQKEGFQRLRELFEGGAAGPLALHGLLGRDGDRNALYTDPAQALRNDLAALAEKAAGFQPVSRFVPFCAEGEFYGVHFVDRIFGA